MTGAPPPRRSFSRSDVKAVGAAQERAHLAGLQFLQRVEEQRRQAVRRRASPCAPPCSASGASENAAATCRKSVPRLQLRERLLGARAAGLDLLRARVLRHRHQDVREVVLVAAARLRLLGLEEVVDLAVGHHDPVVDLALAQARQ